MTLIRIREKQETNLDKKWQWGKKKRECDAIIFDFLILGGFGNGLLKLDRMILLFTTILSFISNLFDFLEKFSRWRSDSFSLNRLRQSFDSLLRKSCTEENHCEEEKSDEEKKARQNSEGTFVQPRASIFSLRRGSLLIVKRDTHWP